MHDWLKYETKGLISSSRSRNEMLKSKGKGEMIPSKADLRSTIVGDLLTYLQIGLGSFTGPTPRPDIPKRNGERKKQKERNQNEK